ncbi:MAG: pirin family protein [Saprospiraceae bacterium]|nr:pirin family protein [Candidatus Brachybacter algidus]
MSPFTNWITEMPRSNLLEGRTAWGRCASIGFETVTIAYSGSVAHHDSAGNAGVVNPGDQWMTAGSVYYTRNIMKKNSASRWNLNQMVQLWVNPVRKTSQMHLVIKLSQPMIMVFMNCRMAVVSLKSLQEELNGVKRTC